MADELDQIFNNNDDFFKPYDDGAGFRLVSRGQGVFREKYRPQRFNELVPTCPIEQLRNQIDNPNASQVFLFEGNSGTGKTTSARILARASVCLAENTYRQHKLSSI